MQEISGYVQASSAGLNREVGMASLGKASLPSPEKTMDASFTYIGQGGTGSGLTADKISFDFNSVFNKSVDLAQIVFQLRLLIRDAQAAEAELVIANIEANANALFQKADTIREEAAKAKEQADAAAWMTILSGVISIAGGVLALGQAGRSAGKLGKDFNPNTAAAQSQAINAMAGGFGGVANGGGQFFANEAELIRQNSQAAQAELDALANMAQADKQRAEAQENFYKDLLANLKKIADDLLQEITQVTRNVGRNI